MKAAEALRVREHPKRWFQGFGRFADEVTLAPTRGRANILQSRMFDHYAWCQANDAPCRMAVVKYRRAGSSTGGTCMGYMTAMNHDSRGGVIGRDYKSSSNMMEMVKFFGKNDDFPGWTSRFTEVNEVVPWEERVEKEITTKLEFAHGSRIELYTAENPMAARSAGLQWYHATELGHWPNGGVKDAGKTLSAMRNTLPKKGFHFALEESTANGQQGAFYETCRTARWPVESAGPEGWWRKFAADWPLETNAFMPELQFVLIFAGWFEDARHYTPVTEEQRDMLEATLDEDEKALRTLFSQDGPKGERLGGAVEASIWEQLAWRRGIIKNVCTKGGAEEFKQEYPSTPLEAFRASGSPAFDQEGVTVLEVMCRQRAPEEGIFSLQTSGAATWERTSAGRGMVQMWERPIVGAKYLLSCDPMSGAEQITGTGRKDNHSALLLRDFFMDTRNNPHLLAVVARIRPPCQWEFGVLARGLYLLAHYYGDCCIVVEANAGIALITELRDRWNANLDMREEFDLVRQRPVQRIGFQTTSAGDSRRLVIATAQNYVREQRIEAWCPHLVGELKGCVINSNGKAEAGGNGYDDDVMALGMGLVRIESATVYTERRVERRRPADERAWKAM